ncbi:adult-specific rigid cuticular protein 15.7-like [Tachypleus tridentatus]|uniref:adult-specific rigid cuticular protein 15.7-like n=1 Tax=Tachypleus tridentatus TaxID=6853 RepID=UPI003FD3F5BF
MIVKIATFFALLVVVRGGLYHGIAGGSSVSSRRQDDFGNYAFNYDIVDPLGATNGHWEAGDGYGNKRGAYSLTDIDGRDRRVEYVADGAGFCAVVKTNEPGTANSAPAEAIVASSRPGVVPYGLTVVKAHVTTAYAYGNPVHAAGIHWAPVYGTGFLKYH